MKKDYNRVTTSDMPLDSSFSPEIQDQTKKPATSKAKINAIGKSTQNKTKKTQVKKLPAKKPPTTRPNQDVDKEEDKKLKTKLNASSVEMADLEKLNEENIKTYSYRTRRNRVYIILLSILLVVTVIVVSVFAIIGRLKANCNMILHGRVNAAYIVDGKTLDEFRTPSSLQGNSILRLDIKIKINSSGLYNVRFMPETYKKGVKMKNTLIYKPNYELFEEGKNGVYYSIEPIQGDQIISLCEGVILDYYYKDSLNADNFKLNFHTYFEKVQG